MHGLMGGGWKRSPHGPPRQFPTLLSQLLDRPADPPFRCRGAQPRIPCPTVRSSGLPAPRAGRPDTGASPRRRTWYLSETTSRSRSAPNLGVSAVSALRELQVSHNAQPSEATEHDGCYVNLAHPKCHRRLKPQARQAPLPHLQRHRPRLSSATPPSEFRISTPRAWNPPNEATPAELSHPTRHNQPGAAGEPRNHDQQAGHERSRLGTVVVAVVVAAPAGYVLSRGRSKAVATFSLVLFIAQALPVIVSVIPLFIVFARLSTSPTICWDWPSCTSVARCRLRSG